VGIAGVKITSVHLYLDEPPHKPIELHLPKGEQPKKLDNGDSQTWSRTLAYDTGTPPVLAVMALDTVGNTYFAERPDPYSHIRGTPHPPAEVPWWGRLFGG
jgi:hypothetical protein